MNKVSDMKNRIYLIIFLSVILFLSVLSDTFAKTLETDSPRFYFRNLTIVCIPSKEVSGSHLEPSIQVSADGYVLNDWDIKQLNPNLYHFRHKNWKDSYWKVDTQSNQAYKVTGGTFGSPKDEGTILEGTKVNINDITKYVFINLRSSYLEYEPKSGNARIVAGDAVIVDKDNLEVLKIGENQYHIRLKMWKNLTIFWKVDTLQKNLYKVKNGKFGFPGGEETLVRTDILAGKEERFEKNSIQKPEPQEVRPDVAKTNRLGVLEDFGFVNVKETRRPKSDWLEAQKALYRELLGNSAYDILIVPFQVQGYAIDRVGRSLMTRYLSYRIENSTDLKVPDPTLIARALGERQRTFDDQDIYRLADGLKVKTLIKGYVGHNRDEKMILTLFVQERDKNGTLDLQTKVTRLNWQDIPFSDEHPPSESFNSILGDVISKLPIKVTKKPETLFYEKVEKLSLPKTITEMVKTKPTSPILSAYYLQLLGSLFPEDTYSFFSNNTIGREYLFERSLVALSTVSPNSPDYALLKARAFLNLHRRPAALTSLRTPSTPEEKAFLALLNGNLPELEKWTNEIKSPLHKLISQIELNDLRWMYDIHLPKKESYEDISAGLDDWKLIINRRLESKDRWALESNLEIKQKLDKTFPLSGFTVEDIVRSKMVVGENPYEGDEIELSAYNHYQKLLIKEGPRFCLNGSVHPVEMDHLYLLYAISESNLLKNVFMRVFNQALPESSLEILRSYETVYKGHPEMTYLKSRALSDLSDTKKDQARENLKKEAKENAYNAYYWSQGQTRTSNESLIFIGATSTHEHSKYYDGDYPCRWFFSSFDGDRENLKDVSIFEGKTSSLPDNFIRKRIIAHELALKYTYHNFYSLMVYHGTLVRIGMKKEADTLLELNRHRFIGHNKRIAYLIENMKSYVEPSEAEKAYNQAITLTPEVWEPYKKLGEYYIKQGEFKKAFETYIKYPLFRAEGNVDHVALSNYAQSAGNQFHRMGAINEAKPFFKLSADYQTGSAAGISSSAILELFNENYAGAAEHFLQCAKRYNSNFSYMYYIVLLHLMGYHSEAWSLFNTLDIEHHSKTNWIAALVGFRMEGKNEDEVRQWLLNQNIKKVSLADAGQYIFITHIIDRAPNKNISKLIEEMDRHPITSTPLARFHLAWFADGYYNLQKHEFSRAFEVFKEKFFDFKESSFKLYSYALPYIVWSAVKSNRFSEIENHLKTYESLYGEDFYSHLSRAFIEANNRNHAEAIKHLKSSLYNFPNTLESTIFPWYQLVEACEWLYEDTGYAEYRTLALEWAKLYQHVHPMFAWAYAVEAKFTNSEQDRLRALAITLYLDKRSEHISKFSDSEKTRALEWLKVNNPFLKGMKKQQKTFVRARLKGTNT